MRAQDRFAVVTRKPRGTKLEDGAFMGWADQSRVGAESRAQRPAARLKRGAEERSMSQQIPGADNRNISRDQLANLLNEDLAREYQAIIAYVVYSQVLKGAEYMTIANQLETHAQEELKHALIISRQIDYLGKAPVATPKP